MPPRTLLQADDVRRAIVRMAHELVETAPDGARLLVLGIPTRGAVLARRLADAMSGVVGAPVAVGTLDVTLYRDDLGSQPTRPTGRTQVPADVDGAVVVLVDDVLFSGRTVRAALDALTALGRPAVVRLAVLVDRGHRELPIRPDSVGRNLPSAKTERIRVQLTEIDGTDGVTIE
ncbi:bifunctional pyr operon transcriptional regulator/uracil phosphoribosyltransferase PyrR [Amnibacterium sp.]|uniref:bifunctional pyr operon transcriptional regulator/uracil phosphoribosyltransferase PyrR n=1 Tax=Amnibacterium sp. TaxID=1872496 RepID=UPI00260306F2|nr:bifunctional pyr operon transcriptional regulator/uracil phosphoribosyltransferase PyrR [Amnibacterium sp.]MCU1473714.1 Bifunctional protein PyrR [Amnibacterium sp.]